MSRCTAGVLKIGPCSTSLQEQEMKSSMELSAGPLQDLRIRALSHKVT